MNLYPINLKLDSRSCLVVGGGNVAARKIESLLDAKANVTVISPQVTDEIMLWVNAGQIYWEGRPYSDGDASGYFLVISATDDEEVNQAVVRDCSNSNTLLNVVDDPDKCDFFVPAVVKQGSVHISISTQGKSPLLASYIRQQLEGQFGPEYAELADILGELRPKVIRAVEDIKQRREIYARIIESDILDLLRQGRKDEVKERIDNVLSYCRH